MAPLCTKVVRQKGGDDCHNLGAGQILAEQPVSSSAHADEPGAEAIVRAQYALRIEPGQSRCGAG